MGRSQRFGIRLGRGWTVLLLLAISFVGAAYWVGPLRPFPAEFQLAVVRQDSLVTNVAVPGVRTPGGAVQFALPLAARNVGAREGAPRRLTLSVPAQYRVFTRRGMLPAEMSQGVPLRRYVVDMRGPVVPPDSAGFRLPGLDTIWLEADLPRYYCTLHSVSVPEFVPAPQFDAATLGNVRIFYSITDGASRARSTGLLSAQLPQELLQSAPAAMPPAFTTVVQEPEAEVPPIDALVVRGARRTLCGDPQSAIDLYTVLWETPAGSRVYQIQVDGAARKRLYDMNRDGIIELETWDGEGDGRFESRREARFEVPEFLNPLPPRDSTMLMPSREAPDSTFLAVFANVRSGPRRFAVYQREDSMRAVADSIRAVTDSMRAVSDSAALRAVARDTAGAAAPDSAWLQLFNNAAAGPFRFTRRPAPAPADSIAADSTRRDSTPAAPRRPSGPRPLGTPVPGYPPPP